MQTYVLRDRLVGRQVILQLVILGVRKINASKVCPPSFKIENSLKNI